MASSFDHCGVCTSRHVSKLSVVWCPDCDEGLCQDCTEHHSLSKATIKHTTVPIDEYHKLPSFISNITLHCDEHDEKYQLYCKEHTAMLCRKCVISEKHVECKIIFPIEDVIQNAKKSVAFTDIESAFQETKENLKLILDDRQKNVSSLSDSKQKLESEISTIRRQINQHLDNIQDHFIAELNKAVENSTQQIQSFIASLRNDQREIDECMEDIEAIKKYATDLQSFLGFKQLGNKLNEMENKILLWTESNNLGLTVVSYQSNTLLQNISNEITTFGKPVVELQSCKLPLQRRKEGQAQLMTVNAEPKTIDHITLTLKTKIKTSAFNVSGCCILPSGKLVVANHDPSCLVLFSPDGTFEREIKLPMLLIYDVTSVDEDTVAVISSSEKNIFLISLKSGNVFKTIHTSSTYSGLTYTNGKFIVSPDEGHLQEISLEDNKTNIIGSSISSHYVASLGNKIFSRKIETNTIVCHNRNGEMLWTFSNKLALKDPRCVTVDEYGNVFVTGNKSNNVVAISSNGKEHKVLLSKTDLVLKPWAIDYNFKLKFLLVVNEHDGQAFVYNVNYA